MRSTCMKEEQWRSNRAFSMFKEPGPRPLGAPTGVIIYFICKTLKKIRTQKKPKSAHWLSHLLLAYLLHSYFLFPKTLTDSSDEEHCNYYGCDLCQKVFRRRLR